MGYKDRLSAETLISQLSEFKERNSPYGVGYDCRVSKPLTWWNLIEDKYENLQLLAKKIFSIVPHSASCERVFSALGWFYGKKRQRLGINNLESLSKIRHYNLTNMRDELSYSVRNKTDDELVKMIEKSYLLNDASDEEDIEDTEISDDESDYLVIPDHEVIVLIINDVVDLNHQSFNENGDNDNLLHSDNDIAMNDDTEFNLEDLVRSQNFDN
jgi:hypothetical protein